MTTATKPKCFSLREIKAANIKKGGYFFHSSNLRHLRSLGGYMTVKANIVTTHLPNGDGFSSAPRKYAYEFNPETGAMHPVPAD